jgi:iron uptake system component EfeO
VAGEDGTSVCTGIQRSHGKSANKKMRCTRKDGCECKKKNGSAAKIKGNGMPAVCKSCGPPTNPRDKHCKEEFQERCYAAVTGAQDYLLTLTGENMAVIVKLNEAVASGNLATAKSQYGKSRAWYERIEVAAGAFGDTDCDIDCRAYAWEFGEASNGVSKDDFSTPGAYFKGFHRIEALVFRDENVNSAKGFASELVSISKSLDRQLKDRSNFDITQILDNAGGLATEIAAKKMSSEEETYSDLSILIFANNFVGIRGIMLPFKDLVPADTWNSLARALDAGNASTSFYTDITDGSTYKGFSKVTTAEKWAIQKAAYDTAAAIGDIMTYLGVAGPAEDKEEVCTPKETPTVYPGSGPQVSAGLVTLRALAATLKTKVANLKTEIDAEKMTEAKAAYVLARPEYEQIETLAGSFEDTDCGIDCRPDSFPEGENDKDFTGFHKIEIALYRERPDSLSSRWANAKAAVNKLVSLVDTLITELNDNSLFSGEKTFEGIIGLAGEVVKKKIASEEETWSGQSLLIFNNNWDGMLSLAKEFYGSLTNAALGPALDTAVANAKACLSSYITVVSGVDVYASYDQMPVSGAPGKDRECVVEKGYVVMQALVDIAKDLKVFDDCNPYHHGRALSYFHEGSHPGGPVFTP